MFDLDINSVCATMSIVAFVVVIVLINLKD